MRINVVFNLESVDELEKLTSALKESATLQARIKLQNELKELKAMKEHLSTQVDALETKRRELTGASNEGSLKKSTITETTEASPDPIAESASSSLNDDADRIIANIDEEVGEVEQQ